MALNSISTRWPSVGGVKIPKGPPKRADIKQKELWPAIKAFARLTAHFEVSGALREIPAATIEQLKTDRFLKYAFYPLIDHDLTATYFFGVPRQELLKILKDPSKLTDEVLYRGLGLYLNNFIGYMPDGAYRKGFIKDALQIQEICRLVDDTLAASNQSREAEEKRIAADKEKVAFSDRLAYFRFCLDVFDQLVEAGQSPEKLRE